ncbi:MAG TPA: DinB family protein [Puia sp.]|nr:DinB family protein [Puia sp.]
MNNQIQIIINNLQEVLNGEPWYGQSVSAIFKTIDAKSSYKKPSENSHSLVQLLYHMNSWAEFTLAQIENKVSDITVFEKKDWIKIDPAHHTWEKGLKQFMLIHEDIINALQKKTDDFLEGAVKYRDYNIRYLLNGLIQHDIYHLGQMVYLNKLLST